MEMEMEVDEGSNMANDKNALFVCCITKKHGLKKTKIPVANFSELKLEALRTAVAQELSTWEWADENDKPKIIDILHTSRILKHDDDVKRVGPLSVVTVIRRDNTNHETIEDHKSAKFIADYAAKRNINDKLRSCSLALRTAFIHPKFVAMIEVQSNRGSAISGFIFCIIGPQNLGDSDMLENIFAIVPELKNDPVGIGIIQDPTLIFHLSDPESLRKVANTKPWIIEAFTFIAASIHQEKGGPPQGIPNHLFNASMFDGEDESMEDDDEDGSSGSSVGGGSRITITREQVAAALSALGGGSSAGASGLSSSNAFGGLFGAPSTATTPQRPSTTPSAPNPVASAGANIQNLMNTLAGAGGGIPGQPLNSDVVARAVTEALRRLTPEQRADQLNAIRNFATQLQQPTSTPPAPAAPAQPQRVVVPPTPRSPSSQQLQQGGSSSSSLSQQYQSQLIQMREMGISDERLSILALRLSEGDVNTAVELIFSGWQGEGSDPID